MKLAPIAEAFRVDLGEGSPTIEQQIRKFVPNRRSPLAEHCVRWLLADAVRRATRALQLSSGDQFDFQLALAADASCAVSVDQSFLESPERSGYFAALLQDAGRSSLQIEVPFQTIEGNSLRAHGKVRLSVGPGPEKNRATVTISVDYPTQHAKADERTIWLSLAHNLFPFRNATRQCLFPVDRSLLQFATQGALLQTTDRETDEDGSLLIEEGGPPGEETRKEQTLFWAHFAEPLSQTENLLFTARGIRHLIGLYSLLPQDDTTQDIDVRDLLSALNLQRKREGIGDGYDPDNLKTAREFLNVLSRLKEIRTQDGRVTATPLQIEQRSQDLFSISRTRNEESILIAMRLATMDHVQERTPLLTTLAVELGLIAETQTIDYWKESLAKDMDRGHVLSSVVRFEQQLIALVREGILGSWGGREGPPSEAANPDKATLTIERQTWVEARESPLPPLKKLTSEGLKRIIKNTFGNTQTAAMALNLTTAQLNLAKSKGQRLSLVEERLRSLGVIE